MTLIDDSSRHGPPPAAGVARFLAERAADFAEQRRKHAEQQCRRAGSSVTVTAADASDRSEHAEPEHRAAPAKPPAAVAPYDEPGLRIRVATQTPDHCARAATVHLKCPPPVPLPSEQDRLRCRVFRDLWQRGWYLTSAAKFGGDFLVYPGDPLRFHSQYIAIVVPFQKPLSPLDIVSFGRLGTTVKKSALLCSCDASDRIVYYCIDWSGCK